LFKKSIIFLILTSVLLLSTSCTEERTIIQNSDTVRIQGNVFGILCGDSCKFSEGLLENEIATVQFTRDNGFKSTVKTNEFGDFELYLSAGSHVITVESGFTYPSDTFYNTLLFPGDTSLNLQITLDFDDPNHIILDFWYPSLQDTAGAALLEQATIDFINQVSAHHPYLNGGPLDLTQNGPDAFLTETLVTPDHIFRTLEVPINRISGWNVKEVQIVLSEAKKEKIDNLNSPYITKDFAINLSYVNCPIWHK